MVNPRPQHLKAAGGSKGKHRQFETYGVPEWVRHPLKTEPLKVGLLFPGEQALSAGIARSSRKKPFVREMLDTAERALGFDVEELLVDGPSGSMSALSVNQPLVFVADCIGFELLREQDPEVASRCQGVAGIGVGEYAALYAAGVITFEQGLRLVKARVEALSELETQQRAKGAEPIVGLSVRGVALDRLERGIKSFAKAKVAGELHIAQHLCPDGFILVGHKSLVQKMQESLAGEQDAELRMLHRCVHAGYTPLAKSAAEQFSKTLISLVTKMQAPRCELYLNSTGRRIPSGRHPTAFIDDLIAQLTEPVQWESCVTHMLNWGIRQFYECGPNRSIKHMLGHFEHYIEAPLEVILPADLTSSVVV